MKPMSGWLMPDPEVLDKNEMIDFDRTHQSAMLSEHYFVANHCSCSRAMHMHDEGIYSQEEEKSHDNRHMSIRGSPSTVQPEWMAW